MSYGLFFVNIFISHDCKIIGAKTMGFWIDNPKISEQNVIILYQTFKRRWGNWQILSATRLPILSLLKLLKTITRRKIS